MRTRLLALLTVVGLLAVGCGGSTDTSGDATTPTARATGGSQLVAQVASFDLATGSDQRVTFGLFVQSDQGPRPLVGGDMQVQLSYVGGQGSTAAEPISTATASFLPVPGQGPDQQLDQPRPAEGGAVGVYEINVDLPDPGLYAVTATPEVAGSGSMTATATFSVGEQHQVPAVGEQAPTPPSPTVDNPRDLRPAAIDSRAANNNGEIPDPQLHDMTVQEAIASDQPTVIVISTPVYCQSQFCGPITETVEQLQNEYGDRANFIHLEVWRNFQDNQLNDAAGAFIRTEQGGNEPWTFLVGADGTIQARWDNVLDAAELEEMLTQL